MRPSPLRLFSVFVVLLALAGCGSSSDETSGSSSSSSNESAVGFWSGTDSVTNLTVVGLVNESGSAVFLRSDGVQFKGSVQVTGSTLAVAVDGYTDFYGSAFSDDSTSGVGTLSGSVTTGSSLTATLSFKTSGGTTLTGNWTLSYSSLSSTGSSLSSVSANYTDSDTNSTVSISSSGEWTSQSGTDSCVLNGTVSTTDSSYDIYQVTFTYEDCTGNDAVLNGISFSGLGVLNTSSTPHQFVFAVSGESSAGVYYSVDSALNLS